MKIVFFDFTRQYGGSRQSAVSLAKRLAVNNEVEVIDAYNVCQDYIASMEEANIKTHILLPEAKEFYIGYKNNKLRRLWRSLYQFPSFWRLQRRLIKKIREINPDVIWTTTDICLLFAGLSFRLRRYPLIRYVCTCLESTHISKRSRWAMKHCATMLIAISTETARQLQLAGIEEDKIKTVFSTVEKADILKRSAKPLESSLPCMDRHPRILLAARLLDEKGQHTAIKAIARLKADGLEPTLWLAGDTYGNDLSYEKYLHDLVEQLELSHNVHFLGWRKDIPSLINACDIAILPTYTEGFPRVVLEAMLLHRPVVATFVGGIKDLVEDGKNGLIFPVDDDETLASHIKRLASNEKYAAELAENGYRTATEKFNSEIHTKRIINALIEAVNRKRKDK
ncbi:MAG: glycosyltransferase [Phycisphaerae bacterium]|jgi:glycosyltransferase involved in cell wall biosynthesis